MIAAIEKMKELKGGFNTKLEEVNAGNIRISELEQNLLLSNQDVLKYKSAMEKALPKFRDLKVELDEKSQEIIRIQIDNTDLKSKLLLLESDQQKSQQQQEQQFERGREEEKRTVDSHIVKSQLKAVENAISVGLETSATIHENDGGSAASASGEDVLEEVLIDTIHPSTVEKLTALVAELKEKNGAIKAEAELTETSLRTEIESLCKVRTVRVPDLVHDLSMYSVV